MNCALHPDAPVAAYCRTCGKALCESCKRPVQGVIYCEDCLGARMHGTAPAAAAPPAGVQAANHVPSPGLAGVLAGFFPFGVGAVYNGQYAKGLAHMLIFVVLVWGASADAGAASNTLFGIGIAFFYVYQIVDAVRSAHAIRTGQPAPDPFGLSRALGGGEHLDMSRAPVGAVILIGLGVLFLLNTLGWFRFFWVGRLWPVILIVLGVWLFARRAGGLRT